MAYQSQDIIRRSATNGLTPAPRAWDLQEEVARPIGVITCIGCKACRAACPEWNSIRDTVGNNVGVYDSPNDLSARSWTVMRFSEAEQNDKLEQSIRKDGCMHCSGPGYLRVCPTEGTIIQYVSGIVGFQSGQCIGCGYCIAGYPFDIPRLNPEDNRVYRCTLYVDHMVVRQEPVYVKIYPTGAVHFGTKELMKTLASERVAELRTRGYDNTSLYDLTGAGGTHVMYVLHHVGKPNLCHGLLKNPGISETVKFWEDIWKPLTAADFVATFAASVFHYVSIGPNRADEEESNLHEEKGEEYK